MKRKIDLTVFLLVALLGLWGCQQNEPAPVEKAQEQKAEGSQPSSAVSSEPPAKPQPPGPPLFETFDGAPQLSLFARLGDYRPEKDDEVTLPFWKTYQEHLVRTAGVVIADETGNRAYSFRSITGIESVGFFSPLKVAPSTRYQVSFEAKGELPEGASAGIGILEYDRFLWVAEQFPRSLDEKHRCGEHPGITFGASSDWQKHVFDFTTGPSAGMIHLVLHREGAAAREPVLFDNIRIAQIQP